MIKEKDEKKLHRTTDSVLLPPRVFSYQFTRYCSLFLSLVLFVTVFLFCFGEIESVVSLHSTVAHFSLCESLVEDNENVSELN